VKEMTDLINMVCPPGTACPLTAMGLPEILLWVLTFAVAFGVLSKLKILSRAPAALISIVVGFLVLMAVPAALITVIASMSTGLVAVGIGLLVLLALIEISNSKTLHNFGTSDKPNYQAVHPFLKHGTAMAILMIIVAFVIFVASGGWALVGFGAIPILSGLGMGTWLLVIVGAAVLWMLSESPKPEPQ
jgi:hypothetical protein